MDKMLEGIPDLLKNRYKKCKRCGHQWLSSLDREPQVCSKCKSYKWNENNEKEKSN